LNRLLSRLFRMEEINGGERCPTYMYRWTLLRAFGCAAYLHKFVADDWSRDLHDHPKRFISIGLWGHYVEHAPLWPDQRSDEQRHTLFQAPWIRTFPATHVHRLSGPTPEHPCWTLVIVGRPVRDWGFWSSGRWTLWTKYLASPNASANKACP
jgi:hypothetical protein